MDARHSFSLIDQVTEAIRNTREPKTPAPTAWFLGPNAENQKFLEKLTSIAVKKHAEFRKTYAKDDPDFAGKDQLAGKAHTETQARLEASLKEFTELLSGSIPLSSYRNQSHMYWDITIPGAVGYFAGMLFNQNNVAAEASPVTTAMEIEVGKNLCRMLGYDTDGAIKPWAHITCDGSVANSESMWAARNLSYHAVAVAAAIEELPELKPAWDVTVRRGDGKLCRLLALTRWQQLNLPIAEKLALAGRAVEVSGIDPDDFADAIKQFSVQSMGILEFHRRFLPTTPGAPLVIVPALAHYSWEKAAGLVGLGMSDVHIVPIDLDGRMRLPELRKVLEDALRSQRPVAQVVAVMGSTAEGAVDPIADIAAIREEYTERGLSFALHADAAWGGYFCSMLRPSRKNAFATDQTIAFDEAPQESLSEHAEKHMRAIVAADTITVDPHKSGFIPYPAGSLNYRDERLPGLIAHTSPVVYHDGEAASVGMNGIEGSKPGAAAVGTLLSHKVIPPDQSGYGRLLGRCVFGAKRFYADVATLSDETTPYHLAPMIRLPAEIDGGTETEVEAQRRLIRKEIVPRRNDQLMELFKDNAELKQLFRRLGPDLTVMAYAVNFRHAGGLNTDLGRMNELNNMLFHKMSLEFDAGQRPPNAKLFVTAHEYSPAVAGPDFVDAYAKRLGVSADSGSSLRFLISTCQNPWITQVGDGSNMVPKLTGILDKIIRAAVSELIEKHGLDPFKPGA